MKKATTLFAAAVSGAVVLILISGYGYIFKAIAMNLKKGPFTPSIDDAAKFPSRPVHNFRPDPWKKSALCNTVPLPEKVLTELKNLFELFFLKKGRKGLYCLNANKNI